MSDWSVKIKRYRELCNSPEAHLVSAKRHEFLTLFEELKALDTTGVLLDEIQALQKENAELKARAKRIKEIVSEELHWDFIEEMISKQSQGEPENVKPQ